MPFRRPVARESLDGVGVSECKRDCESAIDTHLIGQDRAAEREVVVYQLGQLSRRAGLLVREIW